jgi:hypothetical protein
MYLPNLFNHESITEILYELPLWQSLLSLKCHPHARLLLCAILAPVCFQQKQEKQNLIVSFDNNNQNSIPIQTHNNQKYLYPCRTLCESVKQSCEPKMINQFNYKWPTISKYIFFIFLLNKKRFDLFLVDCNQYPKETELCISHLLSTTTTTTLSVPSKLDLCSMCQSELTTSDLVDDYCQSLIVVRTRPIKMSSTLKDSFIFANKHKVRYFKGTISNQTMKIKFEYPLVKCSCIKLYSSIILFISSNGKLIRFISIEQNPNTLEKFRNTIIFRKPRCQHNNNIYPS